MDPEAEHNQISIMIRRDFAVTSEAEILRAGRAAYLKVWPDDTASQADEDVQDLGQALYQVMHAGGVEALNETPGLQPTAGIVLTVAREQLISGTDFQSIVEHPDALFTVEGELLHSQSDAWWHAAPSGGPTPGSSLLETDGEVRENHPLAYQREAFSAHAAIRARAECRTFLRGGLG